jgi:hypothetical protein
MSSHPTDATDIQKLTHAVKELDPSPRRDRWGHLSLCILDSTFSIGIDYDSMVNPLVRRYGKYAGLSSILISGSDLEGAVSPRSDEQTLTEFLHSISDMSDETLAAQILSSHRTSTRNGILKSAASRQIATCLVKEGIETLSDVSTLLADLGRVQEVEKKLNAVKGSGTQGIRTGYIWMTAGDDYRVKPDRHVLNWLGTVLGRKVTVAEARRLLSETAQRLDITPWAADHAIWNHMARWGRP